MNAIVDVEAALDLMPSTEIEEVIQNVRMILGVQRGTVPIDRAFGIDATALDMPLPVAQARLAADIANAIRVFEPRARLTALEFRSDADGRLEPVVKVAVGEEG